jgi:hypothetical protein
MPCLILGGPLRSPAESAAPKRPAEPARPSLFPYFAESLRPVNPLPPTSPDASAQLTFVLPLCGPRDIATARNNLLPSLEAFFALSDLAEILIVGSEREFRSIRVDDLFAPPFAERVRILSENELVGNDKSFHRARGWHKQQIVKLAISRRIRTPLYCTLDSDMFLVRPARLADWSIDGRCIYNPVPMTLHRKWWKRSAKQLNYQLDSFPSEQGFAVTPALLQTRVVQQLVHYLESERHGLTYAIRCGATEYTLYWLYLLKNFGAQQLYRAQPPHLFGGCIWKRYDIAQHQLLDFIDEQFAGNGGSFYFVVLQSTSGVVDDRVAEHIRCKIEASRRALGELRRSA